MANLYITRSEEHPSKSFHSKPVENSLDIVARTRNSYQRFDLLYSFSWILPKTLSMANFRAYPARLNDIIFVRFVNFIVVVIDGSVQYRRRKKEERRKRHKKGATGRKKQEERRKKKRRRRQEERRKKKRRRRNNNAQWLYVIVADITQWLCVIASSTPHQRHDYATSLNTIVNVGKCGY
ncbi:hypothetical protein M9H77_35705 [Catharanthus roseus]|uniref:Uncharacterized protein n=1 Tax=Catharanthus roseus TaxID=4058 RepID=A0ACB9ZQ24_CATRO|nr:hypothetical protein M9H77_35705 [Catharanthus roseus]